jgi:hypothetical protein
MVTNSSKTQTKNASILTQPEPCTTNNSQDVNLRQKITNTIENASASSSQHHGYNIKFMHEYIQEIDKLNRVITTGYDQIFNKFLDLKAKLNKDKSNYSKEKGAQKRNVQATSETNPLSADPTLGSTQLAEQQHKKKIKKVKSTKQPNTTTVAVDAVDAATIVSLKSFVMTDVPIKQERFSVMTTEQQPPSSKSQNETTRIENDSYQKLILNKSVKAKGKKKKKSTLSRISSSSALSITKKFKTKSKKNKKKTSSIISANIKQELRESMGKTSSSSSVSSLNPIKKITATLKSQSTAPPKPLAGETSTTTLSNVQSIKLEPYVNDDYSINNNTSSKLISNNVHASGKVKQMIELVEARLNATPKQNFAAVTSTTTATTTATMAGVCTNDMVNSNMNKTLASNQKIVNRQLMFGQNKPNGKVRFCYFLVLGNFGINSRFRNF